MNRISRWYGQDAKTDEALVDGQGRVRLFLYLNSVTEAHGFCRLCEILIDSRHEAALVDSPYIRPEWIDTSDYPHVLVAPVGYGVPFMLDRPRALRIRRN